MKVGGKHKKKTQIRVRGDKSLRVRKLLEIWKKDTGPDMAQVWPMLDHSLNAMICEWYVESGRFLHVPVYDKRLSEDEGE